MAGKYRTAGKVLSFSQFPTVHSSVANVFPTSAWVSSCSSRRFFRCSPKVLGCAANPRERWLFKINGTIGRKDWCKSNATSWIHRSNELKARRIAHMRIHARNHRFTGFNRLPKRIQHGSLELREFVQK